MSFYSDASLVMIPSGYKTSKVYSAVPTDGAGDLSFSRSNDTATRVNSAGLIEKVRTNLYPRGSALLATGWTSIGDTLTAGQTDPNGGTTALRVQLAAGGSPYSYILQSFTGSAATYARSAYIKAASAQSIRIVDPHSGAGTTVNLTTDWQRFTAAGAGLGGNFGIQFDNNNDAAAKDFTIAFVQIEEGDIATDYIATTTAAVSVGPVANVPRLDYLNSSCPRLLLEGQRTNALLSSEDWTTNWSGANRLVTANDIVSPDGYQNADKLSAVGGGAYYAQSRTTASGANTFSVFLKYGDKTTQSIYAYSSGSYFAQAAFNLQTGTVASTASGTAKIEDYGNGWYRCSVSGTAGSSTIEVGIEGIGVGTYTYAWGAQLEAGAYATSYIPTLGAAVTRGADSTYEESSSALIGQTEGTLFAQFKGADIAGGGASRLSISSGTSANWIFVGTESNDLRAYVRANSSVIFNDTSVPQTGNDKIAIAYKSGSIALYINGAQIATSSSTFTFSATLDDITTGVGGSYSVDETLALEQLIVFPTRLSNSDLAALTA